jgi:L-lactate dehydrogenase complex protein LldF
VLWAETNEEALAFIASICREKEAKSVVKSKSLVAEEIKLKVFLEKQDIKCVETDFGEYVQQLVNDPPVHLDATASHKNREDIARLFHENLGAPPDLPATELVKTVKEKLRLALSKAEIAITGANFLIAEEGAVCITENEGNGMLCTAFPKTHIVIAGIEKVLPSLKHLGLFWPLLSTFGTGQGLAAFNSILCGPRQTGEIDGAQDFYVILLDNGRTNLMRKETRESLYCIRCGACLNACPVYQTIGGQVYDTAYTGPIGSVITPHLKDMHSFGHLSFGSPLCGSCSQSCPVNIDIEKLLIENRSIYLAEGLGGIKEKIAWRFFKQGMLHRSIMNSASPKIKNFIFKKIFGQSWGERRAGLNFPDKSFNQLWKKRQKGNTGHPPSFKIS